MDQTEKDQICGFAVNHFGYAKQLIKAAEECNELAAAILKHVVKQSKESLDKVNEETADVKIMLRQLGMILANDEKVDRWEEVKLKKLVFTIEEEGGKVEQKDAAND